MELNNSREYLIIDLFLTLIVHDRAPPFSKKRLQPRLYMHVAEYIITVQDFAFTCIKKGIFLVKDEKALDHANYIHKRFNLNLDVLNLVMVLENYSQPKFKKSIHLNK